MQQIDYSLKIGPKFDMFGLVDSSPNNPVLLVDNKGSDFELSRIIYGESDSFIKNIRSTTVSARKTRIISNTTDMKMTDVIDENGVPLYNKILIKNIHNSVMYVDGIEATERDSFFIYCNSDTELSLVEYFNKEGEKIVSEYREVHPVFLWQEQLNLKDIIDIDNRKYSFKLSGKNIIISVSKPDVVAEVKNESVFTLKRLRDNLVKMEPFYIETLRSNANGRLSFKYNYMTIVPDLVFRRLEQSVIRSNNIIKLENVDIVKDSIIIYRKKKAGYEITPALLVDDFRDYDVIMDNSNKTYDSIINSTGGKIDITTLLKENLLDYEDVIFINYKFLNVTNILKVEEEDIDLTNKIVHFRIKPTSIRKVGVALDFIPELSYIITDSDGNVVLANDDSIPSFEYELPLYLGYGEGPFGINGFSGETDSFETLTIRNSPNDSIEYGTGYGEIGYSEGPFGGSFLKDIKDIQNLLDIKNNSESGMITVARIEYISKIIRADIYPYKDVSLSNGDIKRKTLYNYNNIVWHNSYDNNHSDIIKRTALDSVETYSTIHFQPYIQFKDTLEVIVEFDIASIHEMFNSIGDIDQSYVLDNSVSQIAFDTANIYSGLMPSTLTSLTDISVFTFTDDKKYEEILLNIDISNDLRTATIRIDVSNPNTSIKNIGLGFKNTDITIYPSAVIII